MDEHWIPAEHAPEGEPVMTKIDDADWGARNIQPLVKHGHMWWTPDGRMYVYYTPTHWRPMTDADRSVTASSSRPAR